MLAGAVGRATPRRGWSADPREALAAIVAEKRESYAALSRMLGRRDGYLATFVRKGHPAALSERDHGLPVSYFGVDDRALGMRELWGPLKVIEKPLPICRLADLLRSPPTLKLAPTRQRDCRHDHAPRFGQVVQ